MISMFANDGEGWLIDDGTGLYSLEGQNILSLLPWVNSHIPIIL